MPYDFIESKKKKIRDGSREKQNVETIALEYPSKSKQDNTSTASGAY